MPGSSWDFLTCPLRDCGQVTSPPQTSTFKQRGINCGDVNYFINPRGKYSHTSCLLPLNSLGPRCLVSRKPYIYHPLKAYGLTGTRWDFVQRGWGGPRESSNAAVASRGHTGPPLSTASGRGLQRWQETESEPCTLDLLLSRPPQNRPMRLPPPRGRSDSTVNQAQEWKATNGAETNPAAISRRSSAPCRPELEEQGSLNPKD